MKSLNMQSIQEAMSDPLVIVDFFAPWCGPCINFAPVFEKFSKEFGHKASFYKVDIDQEQNIAAEYDILSIPTILVFKNGVEIERKFGSMNEIDFRIWINGLLAKHSSLT
jgi:thioredoxin 2